MATLTEDYVSFETALLLKKKGFEQVGCQKQYNTQGDLCVGYCYGPVAPTLQMAMAWLRETYRIDIVIEISDPSVKDRKYYCIIWDGNNNSHIIDLFNSYEEAVEAAIKYVLENLI